ncbi:MAG: hypothetical protein A2898_04245 [Candidatus Kerfeldbacteria bacterium RIFCSPLOWO2_01_FULL_48_11]|uniref:Photosynthesis system II assembly factor Ycf48/Hcf136-like domain-containing protein n=1 Tax=Candidatus Kerfeldbacteria bacterium RIFCSPLOWO2_01_FULL_48_11 TaxID=1798543 RepID=A0A1G2B3G9_9BACT|nr:MAG: hypothetical protein UY34_C0001G0053 [Parcubacteria group bacterium GW2011_GWA2_48_9]KKW16226.1 MAG: hypothetical protein UY52_C0008G0019 [Parcubacteria group bacterium GW2011_GWC2_49_9]OGY82777.1 MAG: hypothetical protein A2898_04245 [Candidatus Kerfeldbacteria bacterium RIFCSPLOWO2_01_FULL_48_11]HCM67773.1 hypothetical protein [Candidatus Kerfeldbacteria bacterium]
MLHFHSNLFVRSIVTTAVVLLVSACTLGQRTPAPNGGVFVSYNAGETWEAKTLVQVTEKGAVTIGPYDMGSLIFHPTDPQIMYFITTQNGVYRTVTGGDQWELTTLSTGAITSLALDPLNPGIVYAAQGGTILKSVDSMATWSTIYVEARPLQTIMSIAIDPSDPSKIYAATQQFIIKSQDFGTTWSFLEWKGTQARKLWISSKNPNILYVLASNYGFYKSSDGGNSWQDLSSGLALFQRSQSISWVDFNPQTERFTIATGYGILTSTDGATSWQQIDTLIPSATIQIQAVVINPDNDREIIFSINNVIHKTVDGGKTWKTLATVPTSRFISHMYHSPHDSSILYVGTRLSSPTAL